MKKLRGIVAILAATALIFGTVACSDGGSNNNTPTPSDPTNDSGTSDPVSGGGGSEGGDDSTTGDPVSYCWNFQTTTTTEVKAVDAGGSYAGKYVLSEDYEYASTPSGMILTMGKGDAANGFVYNKIATDQSLGSGTIYYVSGSNTDSTAGATIGAIEPAGDLVTLKNVQGPFTVKAYVQGNSGSDKTDRYAYIKIDDEEVYAPNKAANTLPALGQVLSYTYEGAKKVNVVLGCAKYMRIYDVVVTTAAAQDQSTSTTTAPSLTLSADKTAVRVGAPVTFTVAAENMDAPSSVDVYIDGLGKIETAALTDGKYTKVFATDNLESDEHGDPKATEFKIYVMSGDVKSTSVTVTVSPAIEVYLYSDKTAVDPENDLTDAQNAYMDSLDDAAFSALIAGVYQDADCTTAVTDDYDGDTYIKFNKTKSELIAWINEQIAAATKYTVTFNANGGVFAADATTSVEVVSGLTVSTEQLATISEPAKTDYTFIGWATTADATEAADLSTVTISGATTLYAVWKSNIVTAVWDWEGTTKPIVAETADATTSTTLQSGATGFATVNAGGNAVSIVVAATGKLSSRDSDAQFNKGTVLKVPVSAGSVLYVKTKNGKYAVNGVKTQAAETTYSAATSAGYVELKATDSEYIYKISVTGLKVTDDFTAQASLTAVPATSLTLSETEALDKTVEDTITLSAVVGPATRTSKVVWSVEGDAVTIDSQDDLDATFTAVAAGTATIKATCDEQVATLTVNVTAADPNTMKVAYFADWDANTTLTLAPTVTGELGTVTNATVNTKLGTITADPVAGEAKSGKGYGLVVATTATIAADTTSGSEIWSVTFTVTPTANVTLTKIAADSVCNKTSNYTLSFYNGDTVLKSVSGASNAASIDEAVSVALASGTAYTFKVAFETKGKEIKAGPFSLSNVGLTFVPSN